MRALARAALVVLALGGGAAHAADEPAPRPAYDVGHLWPLADTTCELVRIEDGQYVFAAPDLEIRLTKALGFAGIRRGGDYLELLTPPEVSWPLTPGDWGVTPGDWRASRPTRTPFARNNMRLSPERLVWRVEGYEDVAIGGRPVRALKILYQLIGSGIAVREVVEWEIAMWYAPAAGAFVKAQDLTFDLVNFELAPAADLAALRARAGLPDPPPPEATSLDARRRHREAATEACGGLKCAAPPSRPPTD